MKEVILPSGAVLKIGNIPFADCNQLKKEVMKRIKDIPTSGKNWQELFKDYICNLVSSDEVERCLWECMKRCTYNSGGGDLKIDLQTFEPVQARQDYTDVQVSVAEECLRPFGKGLFATLQRMLAMATESTPQ